LLFAISYPHKFPVYQDGVTAHNMQFNTNSFTIIVYSNIFFKAPDVRVYLICNLEE